MYYLDRLLEKLYMQFSYSSAVVADTSWTDRAAAQICASHLKPFIGSPKIPLTARLKATHEFLTYLTDKENREQTLGAVARHPVFGGLRFVPTMWDAYNLVVQRVEKRLERL